MGKGPTIDTRNERHAEDDMRERERGERERRERERVFL
jgi:hypothetical protein